MSKVWKLKEIWNLKILDIWKFVILNPWNFAGQEVRHSKDFDISRFNYFEIKEF